VAPLRSGATLHQWFESPMKSNMAIILKRLCCDGARLVKTNVEGHAVFSLEPGGPVSRRAAIAAIKSGRLKPVNDGLFPGLSQSWIGANPEIHTKD